MKSRFPFKHIHLWPHWPTGSERSVFILCLAGSFVCWLILKLTLTYESRREFSIDYLIPEDQVLLSELPDKGEVNLSGRGWRLISYHLWGNPLRIDYELTGINGAGRISADRLRVPLSRRLLVTKLQLDELDYPATEFRLSEKSSKKVPVNLNWEIQLPAGYIFKDSVEISPDSVLLYGGKEQLQAIEQWTSQNVAIEWLAEDSVHTIPLSTPVLAGLSLTTDSVRIYGKLEAYIDRDFIVPITVLAPDAVDSLRVFPDHITITAGIRQSMYDRVHSDSFQVVADLRDLPLATENGQMVPLRLEKKASGLVHVEMERAQANYLLFE
ncbi:MAG: YbbR-like domain-containing protein [Bacteroidota bacterium]